jgi:hypothetical protein
MNKTTLEKRQINSNNLIKLNNLFLFVLFFVRSLWYQENTQRVEGHIVQEFNIVVKKGIIEYNLGRLCALLKTLSGFCGCSFVRCRGIPFQHRETRSIEPPENLVCAPNDQKQFSEQIYLLP